MPLSRCSNCNDYETTKRSNFLRHVERCKKHSRASASLADPATRRDEPAPAAVPPSPAAVPLLAEPPRRGHESRSPEMPSPGPAVQLTRFDAMLEQAAPSDSEDAAWQPDVPAVAGRKRRLYSEQRDAFEATLVSTPLHKAPRARAAPSSRYHEPLTIGERDFLLTRIDELERTVMKLQHAVCVMDSRMQQFRMATSSWQPITSRD